MLWNCKTDVLHPVTLGRASARAKDVCDRAEYGLFSQGEGWASKGGCAGFHSRRFRGPLSLPLLTPCVQEPHVHISVPLSPLMGTLPVDLP